jgi:TatA/E family protein of Tat protein translocase
LLGGGVEDDGLPHPGATDRKEITVNLGAPELAIMLVLALVLFGGAKLPKLARSLGEAKRELEAASAPGATPATGTPGPEVL